MGMRPDMEYQQCHHHVLQCIVVAVKGCSPLALQNEREVK